MIQRSDDAGVAVLSMDHAPVNAMDVELCREIEQRFRALADDPAIAVVLTGSGRTFSAGADLRRLVDGGAEYVASYLPALSGAFRAVFELPKPVVAAVNGHAIAGGCVLAACADAALMTDGSGPAGPPRIGVTELAVGVPFPRVPLEIMEFAVGRAKARRLVLGARTCGPAEALAIGLVEQVVAPGGLVATAIAMARAFARDIPADTFAFSKAQLRRESLERIERYADEDAETARLWCLRATDGFTRRYLEKVTGG